MTNIITRAAAGKPLTYAQMDSNFNNLNTGKAEQAAVDALSQTVTQVGKTANAAMQSVNQIESPSGAALVGIGEDTVAGVLSTLQFASYAVLRSYSGTRQSVYVTGYVGAGNPSGIAGTFVRDDSDTTTVDNGGTVIVSNGGKRWKRVFSGPLDIRWFGAKSDGSDSATSINAAIMTAYAVGGGEVLVPGRFGVASTISLLAGVYLVGLSGADYHAGMQYSGDTDDQNFGSRIYALPSIPANTDLVVLPIDSAGSVRRRRGRGSRNIILDGANLARYVLSDVGDGTDARTTFDESSFIGAISHNIFLANTIALTFNNSVSSASGGFGIRADYGVSDSSFNGLYIHTNQLGGYFFGDGSLYNQINGGKCEDNYGPGLTVSQSGSSSTIVQVDGTVFQHNNGPNQYVTGTNAQLFSSAFRSNGSAAAGQSGGSNTHVYVSAGRAVLKGGLLDKSANYVFSALSAGVITVGGDVNFDGGITATTFTASSGLVRMANAIPSMDGKLPLRNRGGRKQLLSIGASASGQAVFPGAFENGLGANFYDTATYLFTVVNSPYPTNPGSVVIGLYSLVISGNNGSIGSVNVVPISPAVNASYIASVSASVSGSNITITIATGSQPGTGGQSGIFNVSLIDIGQNMFGFDG